MHNFCTIKQIQYIIIIALTFFPFCSGCGTGSRELPVEKIKQGLKASPDFSIILDDMKEEGNFVIRYFHKYRIINQAETGTTDWLEVPKNYYKANETFLGMTLFAKKNGQAITSIAPPGYQHVGDPEYGRWQNDARGGSFWEFYGKYAFFSSLLGGFHRPIYRDDFNAYRQYRNRQTPYFGKNNQYGTNGSVSKATKPNFYARRQAKARLQSSSFSDKVSRRIGRTRTGFRSRAGGFGK